MPSFSQMLLQLFLTDYGLRVPFTAPHLLDLFLEELYLFILG
jgi:hypothetical protein